MAEKRKDNRGRILRTGESQRKAIANIRNSDMIKFYNSLLDKGLSSGYLHIIHAFLHPAFEMAVADDLIRKNPCSGVMSKIEKTETVKKSYDD